MFLLIFNLFKFPENSTCPSLRGQKTLCGIHEMEVLFYRCVKTLFTVTGLKMVCGMYTNHFTILSNHTQTSFLECLFSFKIFICCVKLGLKRKSDVIWHIHISLLGRAYQLSSSVCHQSSSVNPLKNAISLPSGPWSPGSREPRNRAVFCFLYLDFPQFNSVVVTDRVEDCDAIFFACLTRAFPYNAK